MIKKIITVLIIIFIVTVSCKSKGKEKNMGTESKKIRIVYNVQSGIINEISDSVKESLRNEGYDVEFVYEYTDDITVAVSYIKSEYDAGFGATAREVAYNNKYRDRGRYAELAIINKIYGTYAGFFSKKIKSKEEIDEYSNVYIYNRAENQDRALRILEKEGIIKLTPKSENTDKLYNINDIVENNKNITFILMNSVQEKNKAFEDGSIVFSWKEDIIEKGMDVEDIFYMKEGKNQYENLLISKKELENSEKIKILKKSITSDKVRKIIEKYEQYYTAF